MATGDMSFGDAGCGDGPPELTNVEQLLGSDDPADVEAAYSLAVVSMSREPRARRLAATAYDRGRALQGRPQKFGTCAVRVGGVSELWPCEPHTTDTERAKWGLPSLAQLEQRVHAAPLIGKAALRRLLRGRRRQHQQLAAMQPDAAAVAVAGHAAAILTRAPSPAVVAASWPLPGELDARPLARALAAATGARLALPVMLDDAGAMTFREWRADVPLQPAGFGTSGPPSAAAELVPDLVLLPLLGFDELGARLGQGLGCYDRWLQSHASAPPLSVGVAWSWQQVPRVPTESHDVALAAIATELGLGWCDG